MCKRTIFRNENNLSTDLFGHVSLDSDDNTIMKQQQQKKVYRRILRDLKKKCMTLM